MPKKKNKFELVQMPPQNTNSVVIFDGNNCVVFDPWGRAEDWEKYFVSHDVTPTAIYATHGHPDHISAAAQIATRFNIDWYMSHMDLDLIEWGNGLLDYFNLPKLSPNDKAPIDIKTGEYTVLSDIKMHVIALPGHTRGGVGYFSPGFYDLQIIKLKGKKQHDDRKHQKRNTDTDAGYSFHTLPPPMVLKSK